MLEEFESIVGTEIYSVFLEMLESIGPDARTHRICMVIAAMMRYTRNELIDEYQDNPLAMALIVLDEEPYLASEGSEEVEILEEFIDELCSKVGMHNRRESASYTQYSIAEHAIAEYSHWYFMPWEDY